MDQGLYLKSGKGDAQQPFHENNKLLQFLQAVHLPQKPIYASFDP